jgi:hypothetical protein
MYTKPTKIRLLSVDDCLKNVVNGHNSISYGGSGSLVFKEKGKNHWLADSKGKTIVYRVKDNNFIVDMNQNYFKISYYNHNGWDDKKKLFI